jgi:hypothetical protein
MSNKILRGALILVAAVALTACGSSSRKSDFSQDYKAQQNTKVELLGIKNDTGQTFDVDIETLLSDALSTELNRQALLWKGDAGPRVSLKASIIEYEKGDAFKRWLVPGWGATVVTIRCEVLQDGKAIGSVDAKRSVSAGGGYTVGAWRTIFAEIAKDAVKELRPKIRS